MKDCRDQFRIITNGKSFRVEDLQFTFLWWPIWIANSDDTFPTKEKAQRHINKCIENHEKHCGPWSVASE